MGGNFLLFTIVANTGHAHVEGKGSWRKRVCGGHLCWSGQGAGGGPSLPLHQLSAIGQSRAVLEWAATPVTFALAVTAPRGRLPNRNTTTSFGACPRSRPPTF